MPDLKLAYIVIQNEFILLVLLQFIILIGFDIFLNCNGFVVNCNVDKRLYTSIMTCKGKPYNLKCIKGISISIFFAND